MALAGPGGSSSGRSSERCHCPSHCTARSCLHWYTKMLAHAAVLFMISDIFSSREDLQQELSSTTKSLQELACYFCLARSCDPIPNYQSRCQSSELQDARNQAGLHNEQDEDYQSHLMGAGGVSGDGHQREIYKACIPRIIRTMPWANQEGTTVRSGVGPCYRQSSGDKNYD